MAAMHILLGHFTHLETFLSKCNYLTALKVLTLPFLDHLL